MGEQSSAAFCFDEARRLDPDRFLCALFAPPHARDTIVALLALNQELGRVAETVSQPLTGLIRLQWWRDAIGEAAAGRPRAHPIVRELAPALQDDRLAPDTLVAMVDAREDEIEGLDTSDLAGLEARARGTAGLLQRLTATSLGATDTAVLAAAEDIGTAWGIVGLVRATRHLHRHERRALPPGDEREVTAAAMTLVDRLLSPPRVRFGAGRVAAFLALPARDYRRGIALRGHDPMAAADLERSPLLPARLWLAHLLQR